jgi:hypothetical protein
MDLVRDLLDKSVLDANGRELGRTDGIVLELRKDAPPRVAAIELGPAVLFARIAPVAGRWAAGLQHALGFGDGRPRRVAFAQILDINRHIRVDAREDR